MLAYARLIIREAQRHGGLGWLDYDRVFRQQSAIDDAMQWNTLHPGIQAATLLGQTPGQGTFCTLCRGADHRATACALTYLKEPSQSMLPVVTSGPATDWRRRPQPDRLLHRSAGHGIEVNVHISLATSGTFAQSAAATTWLETALIHRRARRGREDPTAPTAAAPLSRHLPELLTLILITPLPLPMVTQLID